MTNTYRLNTKFKAIQFKAWQTEIDPATKQHEWRTNIAEIVKFLEPLVGEVDFTIEGGDIYKDSAVVLRSTLNAWLSMIDTQHYANHSLDHIVYNGQWLVINDTDYDPLNDKTDDWLKIIDNDEFKKYYEVCDD